MHGTRGESDGVPVAVTGGGGGADSGTGRVENQKEWWALRWQLWAGGGGGGGGGGGFGYNDSIVVLHWQYHRRTMVVPWSYNGRTVVVQ